MADRFQTNIAGFDLDCETISDGFQKSIVKHEYPNRNGAMLEDMGQKARVITIRCYFGVGGMATYEDNFDFIDALDSLEKIEYIDPDDGVLKGSIEKVDRRRNDRIRTAEVDITFIEERISDEPTVEPSPDGSAEESFLLGQEENAGEAEIDVEDALGPESVGILEQTLNAGQGIIEQYTELKGKARSFVNQVDIAVRTLEGTLSAVTQPANSIISTINYATNLPGRIVGAVARCVERYAESYNTLRNAPAQFSRSLRYGLLQLEQSFSSFRSTAPAGSVKAQTETAAMTMAAKQINLAASQRLALEAGYAFKTDQLIRQSAKSNEKQKSFDLLGNYLYPVLQGSLMNVLDIESVLAEVMTASQRSVDAARENTGIKKAVVALVQHARTIKIESEKIRSVDIDGTIPIHLLCLKYGLPYNAAERILAINPQIKHPNFMSGTINIYTN